MDDDDTPRRAALDTEETVEEEQADWQAFASLLTKKAPDQAVPFIPKRGEKDFEPVQSLATLQATALQKSRDAMFAALKAGDNRQHQSKQHNEAVWHPELERGSIKSTAGIHFSTLGHYHPVRKRVELFPEEMLYLLERGTLECWTEQGVAMSAQQGFATFLGTDELTMERYQVYAYLKRLGYVLLRFDYGGRPPIPPSPVVRPSLWENLLFKLRSALLALSYPLHKCASLLRICDPPRLLSAASSRSLLTDARWRTYRQAFERVRVIPAGFSQPLHATTPDPTDNPFKVFWHVWKPVTKFQKSNPPAPDFYVSVVDGARHGMPTVSQLSDVFEKLPPTPAKATPPAPRWPSLQTLFFWRKNAPPRKPSPYPRLKNGEKTLVVAVVENGTSYFLKFGPAAFEEHAWV